MKKTDVMKVLADARPASLNPADDSERLERIIAGAGTRPPKALAVPRRGRIGLGWAVGVAAAGVAVASTLVLGSAGNPSADPAARQQPAVLAAGVSPFMAGDWTEDKPEIAVFLCKAGSASPSCGAVTGSGEGTVDSPRELIAEGKGITASQQADLERVLRARPELVSVTFEDRQTAYTKFQQEYSDTALAAAVTVNDLPESFRLKMKPDADWSAVAEAVKDMPGVDTVINQKCISEGDRSDPAECVAR